MTKQYLQALLIGSAIFSPIVVSTSAHAAEISVTAPLVAETTTGNNYTYTGNFSVTAADGSTNVGNLIVNTSGDGIFNTVGVTNSINIGAVGSSTSALGTLGLGATTVFTDDVYANVISVGDIASNTKQTLTTAADKTVKGSISINGSGNNEIIVGSGATIVGDVTPGSTNLHDLTFSGAATVTGNVAGASTMRNITLSGTSTTVAVSGTANATTVNLGSNTLSLGANSTIHSVTNASAGTILMTAGNLNATSSITGLGTLTLRDTAGIAAGSSPFTVTNLTKTGTGTSLVDTTAATTATNVTVSGGTLSFSTASAASGTVTMSGADATEIINLNSAGTFVKEGAGASTVTRTGTFTANTMTLSGGAMTFTNGATSSGLLTLEHETDTVVSNISSADGISKSGAGKTTLNNATAITTGAITISAGSLEFQNGTTGTTTLTFSNTSGESAITNLSSASTVVKNGAGNATVGSHNATALALTNVSLDAGNLTFTNGASVSNTLTLTNAADHTLAGISSIGTIEKSGAGKATITANSGVVSVGAINISAGGLDFTANSTVTNAITATGTENTRVDNIISADSIVSSGTGTLTFGNTITATNGITVNSGNITMNAGTLTSNAKITLATAGTSTIAGEVLVANGAEIESTGTGTTNFTGKVTANEIKVTTGNVAIGAESTFTTASIGNGTFTTSGTTLGTVTALSDGNGTLILAEGGIYAAATIGSSTEKLHAVSASKNTTFTDASNIHTNNFSATSGSALTVNGLTSITQNVNLIGGGQFITAASELATSSVVTTDGAGTGNITLGDNAVVNGKIGEVTKIGKLILGTGTHNINAGSIVNATTTDFSGTLKVNAGSTFNSGIIFNDDGRAEFLPGSTIAGNISSATPGQGTLDFTSGTLTINGNLERINALNIRDGVNVTGNVHAANTTEIGKSVMNVTGNFNAINGQQLNFNVDSATTSGQIKATQNINIAADTKIKIDVNTGVYVTEGQTFDIITSDLTTGNNVATVLKSNLTTTNTALIHFVQEANANKFVIKAARTQMTNAVTDTNAGQIGQMLDALGGGGDKDIQELQIKLGNFMSTAEVENVLNKMTPVVSGGTTQAAQSVSNSTGEIVGARMSGGATGSNEETGTSSGNFGANNEGWFQAFGAHASQDARKKIAGYDANTYGMIIGVDTEVTDDAKVGIALAYADTRLDGKDQNRSKTDVDSYQVTLYGHSYLPYNFFIQGQASYMYSDIHARRHNVANTGRTATADYNSDQYTLRADAGHDFYVTPNFTLTPGVLAHYSYIDTDNYSEKGAGGLGLKNVATSDVSIFELGVNLTAEGTFSDNNGGLLKPNVHAGYRYDFEDDVTSTVGFLAGGGSSFRTQGASPDQETVNVGAGLKWESQYDVNVSANYDYETKSSFDAHSGYLRVGVKF